MIPNPLLPQPKNLAHVYKSQKRSPSKSGVNMSTPWLTPLVDASNQKKGN
jgi:hypothetical protein